MTSMRPRLQAGQVCRDTFTFTRGQSWIDGLPQFGWEMIGGWSALVIYVTLLGMTLFVRWRSGAWKRIAL